MAISRKITYFGIFKKSHISPFSRRKSHISAFLRENSKISLKNIFFFHIKAIKIWHLSILLKSIFFFKKLFIDIETCSIRVCVPKHNFLGFLLSEDIINFYIFHDFPYVVNYIFQDKNYIFYFQKLHKNPIPSDKYDGCHVGRIG